MTVEPEDFLRKNHYVLFDGKKKLVTDVRQVSARNSGSGGPDYDALLDGEWTAYDPARITPLPAGKTPGWLQEGAAVTYNNPRQGRHLPTTVRAVFTAQAEGEKPYTCVRLSSLAPMKFDGRKIRPRNDLT